ncbi:hypothetical protein CRUP_004247, partial [Coryphaenoides rupestris]
MSQGEGFATASADDDEDNPDDSEGENSSDTESASSPSQADPSKADAKRSDSGSGAVANSHGAPPTEQDKAPPPAPALAQAQVQVLAQAPGGPSKAQEPPYGELRVKQEKSPEGEAGAPEERASRPTANPVYSDVLRPKTEPQDLELRSGGGGACGGGASGGGGAGGEVQVKVEAEAKDRGDKCHLDERQRELHSDNDSSATCSADEDVEAEPERQKMYTMDKPSMLMPAGTVLVSAKLNSTQLSMQQLHNRAATIPPMHQIKAVHESAHQEDKQRGQGDLGELDRRPPNHPAFSTRDGKPCSFMPYDMKLALEQEAQSGLRPASPYRLSPRELSKASAQSNPSTAPNVSCY